MKYERKGQKRLSFFVTTETAEKLKHVTEITGFDTTTLLRKLLEKFLDNYIYEKT